MTPEDYLGAYRGKVAARVELVRQGTRHIAERGSFTQIAGVLNRDPVVTGSAAAMVNGRRSPSCAPRRSISLPSASTPSVPPSSPKRLAVYGDLFPPGSRPTVDEPAAAYVRSFEGAETGRVFSCSAAMFAGSRDAPRWPCQAGCQPWGSGT